MSEDENSLEEELFESGEMIVLTLKDGRHYLGEFLWFDEAGVSLKIEAKTEMVLVKAKKTKFENLVEQMVNEEAKTLISPKDWIDKAVALSRGAGKQLQAATFVNTDLQVLKKHVMGSLYEFHRANIGKLWTGPTEEQDVTKPYLRQLKRSIRTLVPWYKIEEICSATELAEEAEIADLSNLIDNGEFFKLIENMTENDN